MIKVAVQLTEMSQPREHEALNAYVKGPLYCVQEGTKVYKYPLDLLWARRGGLRNPCLGGGGVLWRCRVRKN